MMPPMITVQHCLTTPGCSICIEPAGDIAACDLYLTWDEAAKLIRRADSLAEHRKTGLDMIAITVGYNEGTRYVWASRSPGMPPGIGTTRPQCQFAVSLETADFETMIERVRDLLYLVT